MKYLILCLLAFASAVRADVMEDARAQLKAGHRDEAISLLRAAVARDSGAVRPNVLLAEVLLEGGELDEAERLAQGCLAGNPKEPEFHRVVGDVLYREGRITDADQHYKAAIKLDSKDPWALLGEARVFSAACLRKRAELLLQQAHSIQPDNIVFENWLTSLEGDSSSAVTSWKEQLAALEDKDSERARTLRNQIAITTELAGKHRNEVAGPYSTYEVPIVKLMNGTRLYALGLPLTINGARTELELDTGAHGFLISSQTAAKAGVKRLGDIDMGGIGNESPRKGWIGYAESIHVGDVEFRNCIVEVSDRGSVTDSGGLIGMDVFRRFLVKLDFRTLKVLLSPLPGPAWDGYAPVDRYTGPELADFGQVFLIHHFILVPTKVSQDLRSEDATPALFLLDTGSAANMISTNMAQNVTKLRDSQYMRLKGVSGRVKNVYEADKVVLQFDRFRQKNLGLTSIGLTSATRFVDVEVSGVMGMPLLALFSSVTLDYRDGRVRFEYKP